MCGETFGPHCKVKKDCEDNGCLQKEDSACPFCKKPFKCVERHLPHCKVKKDCEDNGCLQKEDSACPFCKKPFKCVERHLPHCKVKKDCEDNGCLQKEDSACPFCKKPFKCVERHLPHCKVKKDGEDNGCLREEDSCYKQQCLLSGKNNYDCHRRSVLERKLCDRLRKTKVNQRQEDSLLRTLDKIKSVILETLEEDLGYFSNRQWQAVNMGSYYECIKVCGATANIVDTLHRVRYINLACMNIIILYKC